MFMALSVNLDVSLRRSEMFCRRHGVRTILRSLTERLGVKKAIWSIRHFAPVGRSQSLLLHFKLESTNNK